MVYTHIVFGPPGSGQDFIASSLIDYLKELSPGQTSQGMEKVEKIGWGNLKNWDVDKADEMNIGRILKQASIIKFENKEVEHIVICGAYALCHWRKAAVFGKNTSFYFVRRTSDIDAIEFTENFYNNNLESTLGPDHFNGFMSWAKEMHEELDNAVERFGGSWVPFNDFVTGPHKSVIVVPPTINEAASKQVLIHKL